MSDVLRRGAGPWPTDNREATVVAWLRDRLALVEESEREGVARWLADHVSERTRGDRMASEFRWSESQLDRLAVMADRVAEGEPIQHVVGEVWFDGVVVSVNGDVLIPRPETEELVAHLACRVAHLPQPRVVDWCTGSGCLALALKRRVPHAFVEGLDLSLEALDVARKNGVRNGLSVAWGKNDLLASPTPNVPAHLVVSNPPYIPHSEKSAMHPRVTDHEPHLALFVPDDDPLCFYRALVTWCELGGLESGGWLGMECHAQKTQEVAALLAQDRGWKNVKILLDLQGLPRHVVARRELP
jgi:release factor glutamine methyltransferase